MNGPEIVPERPQARRFVALIVIGVATAQVLGLMLKMRAEMGSNDISRWCTVWSLLERGTYAIDDCPWQYRTLDKVRRSNKMAPPGPTDSPIYKLEYALAPRSWKEGEPVEHFYSSKPPLLATLIAGVLYPFRVALGVPLDRTIEQQLSPRYVQKKTKEFVLETPKEPMEWPAYVFYFDPILVLLNVVPFLVFLVLYARLLDRYAPNDWAWFLSLFAAAWGTLLVPFEATLNNHTIAATSAFFALYPFIRIWDEGARSGWLFAAAGFFGAFCACNELPAALFGLLLFGRLLARFPRPTLLYFAPAAAVPCAAFLVTQLLAFGQLRPVYEEFGTKSYTYAGSYWNTPLQMDWFNTHPEPKTTYLFHMTLGHHGVFSLTPLFLFSLIGGLRLIWRNQRLSALAWLSFVLTVAMFAFYTWNPKAHNYGGSTSGLRWLFWLIPFWLILLPAGVEAGQSRRWVRWLSLAALVVSVFSVGYAQLYPWSHPWILDALEHLNLYTIKR